MKKKEIVLGYKATDENMRCKGFQFELGVWHKHDGEIAMCESGFHFCEYPSGPWSFYQRAGTRIFKVKAMGVIKGDGPGADLKHVAMEIMLTEEILFSGNWNTGNRNTGDRNTGDSNTGYSNTGDWNTGDSNTGDWNTGDSNTGDWNTGYRNTGYSNTGNRNTGDRNTGDWNTGDSNTGYSNTGNRNTGNRNTGYRNTGNRNTGDRNTGDWNTGDSNTGYRNTGYSNTGNRNTGNRNTGDWNTGDRNTGNGNCTDSCSGHLCIKIPQTIIFDETVKPGVKVDIDRINELANLMMSDNPITDFSRFLSIPNATEKKIKTLHAAHIKRRYDEKEQA